MSYKPKCLGHINIFVRNAERSQEWYADVLGLHTYDLRPDAAFMAADIEQSHEIALVQVGDDAPGPERGRVGLNHMAWYMETLEDLKEFYLRVKRRTFPSSVWATTVSPWVFIYKTPMATASRCSTSCPGASGPARRNCSPTWAMATADSPVPGMKS